MEILNRKLDKIKTRSDYKKVVWFYDFWSWLTESKAAKKVIEFSEIKSGKNILEVACGTGVVFEKIVRKNPNGKNIGIDLSPDMLKKAEERLNKIKNANYELKEGDALNLNFQDNFFDIVINNFMVDLMPVEMFDKVANEFYRVTKPDGILVLSTFSFGKKKVNKFWHWVAKRFPDLLTGCRPVSFKKYLLSAGFEIERNIEISQNTFPSEIIKAKKK
jgi:ubiquinone/menaquinone biosynthesis C-methylase UbiE